jgi:hypothetical protein
MCANVTGTFVGQCYSAPSKVLVTQAGTWIMALKDNVATTETTAVVRCTSCSESSQSWGAQVTVWTETGQPDEASYVQLLSGTIYGVIRDDDGDGYYETASTDDGQSWSATPTKIINSASGKPALTLYNGATQNLFLFMRLSNKVYYSRKPFGGSWSTPTQFSASQYCYASGIDMGTYAGYAICEGAYNTSDAIVFQQFNYLLHRDIAPASNDNSPVGLDRVA